ncbi:GNAT family N-acetyltransferase [Streptomyces sp. NBC_01537]|uniref:GNAT family N-acetyltransferase n=1 Tax=Streptomyces sp. NBC_01537 TaxID=2903896 RepID=UPI00386EBF56
MPELQLLRPDHAPGILAFERETRAYFAASIPDRGEDYFARFDERHCGLLAEQEAGVCYFHVLVGAAGEVLGRINLVDVADGAAELGYRIAERAAGQGLATSAVREMCGGTRTASSRQRRQAKRRGLHVRGTGRHRGAHPGPGERGQRPDRPRIMRRGPQYGVSGGVVAVVGELGEGRECEPAA